MAAFENYQDFEQFVAILLKKAGWEVIMPPMNQKGYDIEARKGSYVAAVQVKNYRAKVKAPYLEKFVSYLETPEARRFNKALYVTSSSYSPQSLAYYNGLDTEKIKLASVKDGNVTWIKPDAREEPPARKTIYVGVFTSKGGVGKTTVAAHLAGAMAMTGYDVALVDLDPQKNLTTLLGDGVAVPAGRNQPKCSVAVYNAEDWDDEIAKDVAMVVCDCSPVFENNPRELMRRFDYCLIPTTLNPLGLNKNGHVIRATIQQIREVNSRARAFVLINNYVRDTSKARSATLRREYKKYFEDLSKQDLRFAFIDPKECCIRHSAQLYYWGYHIFNGANPELAFRAAVGGVCHPRADFLNLLQFLEENSGIEEAKEGAEPASAVGESAPAF
jgi:chromosome partitioning protein